MPTTLQAHPMHRPKGMPVRLDTDVIESARILSSLRNEPMATLLSSILRPILQELEQTEMAQRLKTQPKPPRKPKDQT